jgi:hypothetical protein
MSDPTLALQKALYARLSASISCPAYDDVPQDAPMPYTTFDREFSRNTTPISGKDRQNRLFYLSVWSNYPGQAEVKRVMAEIYAALNEQPLALEVGRVISVRVMRSESTREPDGRTYMGSVTLQIITQH